MLGFYCPDNRVLQADQGFGGLNFIYRLDAVNQHVLQGIDGLTHHFDKHAVVACGVVGLYHFFQLIELGDSGGIVTGTLEIDADKAADIIAQSLGINRYLGSGDDTGLFHLFDPDMNRACADAEAFGQLSKRGSSILHQGFQDLIVQLISLK